jgi:hypothetical protein
MVENPGRRGDSGYGRCSILTMRLDRIGDLIFVYSAAFGAGVAYQRVTVVGGFMVINRETALFLGMMVIIAIIFGRELLKPDKPKPPPT